MSEEGDSYEFFIFGEPGAWWGRLYREGEHVHSTEGGSSLTLVMREAQNAISEDQIKRRAITA